METKAVTEIGKHAVANFFFHGGIVFSMTALAGAFEPLGSYLTFEINTVKDALILAAYTGGAAGILGSLLAIDSETNKVDRYEIPEFLKSVMGKTQEFVYPSNQDMSQYKLSDKLGLNVRGGCCFTDYIMLVRCKR